MESGTLGYSIQFLQFILIHSHLRVTIFQYRFYLSLALNILTISFIILRSCHTYGTVTIGYILLLAPPPNSTPLSTDDPESRQKMRGEDDNQDLDASTGHVAVVNNSEVAPDGNISPVCAG